MSDTDDDYLDEYVENLLHGAVYDVSRGGYEPPGNFSYQEETFLDVAPAGWKGRGNDERDVVGLSSPIIQTYVLRRSFSSPAIPEHGRYIRGIPASGDPQEGDDVHQTGSSQWDDREMAHRYSDYYRSLDPYRSDNYRREQVNPELLRRNASRKEPEADDSFVTVDEYDVPIGWREDDETLEEPTRVRGYRYFQREKLRSEDDDSSYLEEGPQEQRRPIIKDLGEKSAKLLPASRFLYEQDQRFDEKSEPQLCRAEQHIDYLCHRLDELVMERDDLIEYVKSREHEWMDMSEQLHAEIIDLRQQNTSLLSERFTKGRRLSKRMADALLKTQQESDRALATTIERQQKINELRLLVTMQQRYILALEESICQLQTSVENSKPGASNPEEVGEGSLKEPPLRGFPQRHPAEGHRYSSINDVIHCDRSKYIPGKTTDPELATAEIFNFGGEDFCESRPRPETSEYSRKEGVTFEPLDVPYVRGGLLSN